MIFYNQWLDLLNLFLLHRTVSGLNLKPKVHSWLEEVTSTLPITILAE